MEEISWGQKFFNGETPETYKLINVQEETTIHNLPIFQGYLDLGFMIAGIAGSFIAFFQKSISIGLLKCKESRFLADFIPTKDLTGYFLLIAIYTFIYQYITPLDLSFGTNSVYHGEELEVGELSLSIGIFLVFSRYYFLQLKKD